MNFETSFPLLSLLIFTPVAGALLVWLSRNYKAIRMIALITNLLLLSISIVVVFRFDASSTGFQFIEKVSWIATLNIHYSVGIDGISVLFLPLTAILFTAVIIASWTSIRNMPNLYFALLLLLETALLGIFCALDTILFFLFWELTLIPVYFLVSLWGIGPNRRFAAVKYTLFMLTGGIPLIFGFVILAFSYADGVVPAQLGFDYINLLEHSLPAETQTTVFILLLLGFAFKAPVSHSTHGYPQWRWRGPLPLLPF